MVYGCPECRMFPPRCHIDPDTLSIHHVGMCDKMNGRASPEQAEAYRRAL